MHTFRVVALRVIAAVVAFIMVSASPGRAALEQGQVLLLYNSQNATSLAIRNAYIAKYPGVLQFDINIAYPALAPGDLQSSTPPEPWRMNNQFITRKEFDERFFNFSNESLTNYQSFLAEQPQIRAIATTRGLPAAVDDNFNPNSGLPYTTRSFESLLAANRSASIVTSVPNPYYGWDVGFDEFLHACGQLGPNGLPPHAMYLVCRLDSGAGGSGAEGDYLAATIAMIERSGVFGVNQYGVTSLTDGWTERDCLAFPDLDVVTDRMYRAGWCVARDTTSMFIHGPSDPLANLQDPPFSEFPTIALVSHGRNHSGELQMCAIPPGGGESVLPTYVAYYEPHPAGCFYSIESWSGWGLHSPGDAHPAGQGFAPDWIGAGGGFCLSYVDEPAGQTPWIQAVWVPSLIMPALYMRGLSFAESAYLGIPRLGTTATSVGDPLARVVAFDPDVDDDRIIGQNDILIVEAHIGQPGPVGDVNRDGIVNVADLELVLDVFGRDASVPPGVPVVPFVYPWNALASQYYPPFGPNEFYRTPTYLPFARCKGDTTGEGCVTAVDVSNIDLLVGTRCPEGDVNRDGVCDMNDVALAIANLGANSADVNLDGVVNSTDAQLVFNAIGLFPVNPAYDINCDGIVGFFGSDYQFVFDRIGLICMP